MASFVWLQLSAENKGICGRYFGEISRFRVFAELQGFICLPISVFLAKPEKYWTLVPFSSEMATFRRNSGLQWR
ncbi:hypothetical protein [Paenibacillus sp. P36]|uniref:hypothetical protein n=1 Tax=Paenibacillus sp. P36 TaxID=3342538 RepID=UPI0038B25B80